MLKLPPFEQARGHVRHDKQSERATVTQGEARVDKESYDPRTGTSPHESLFPQRGFNEKLRIATDDPFQVAIAAVPKSVGRSTYKYRDGSFISIT